MKGPVHDGEADHNNGESGRYFPDFLFPLKRDFEKTVVFALIQTEEALNRRQINQALLSTGDLAHDEF